MNTEQELEFADLDWDSTPQVTFLTPWRCGELHWKTDPHTGKRELHRWTCKDRDCPTCTKVKQLALKGRLEDIYHLNKSVRVILHNGSIADLNKEYPERLHLPFSENEYYSLVVSDKEEGQPLTPELIDKLSLLAVAPKGKRMSGNLGKKPALPKAKKEEGEEDLFSKGEEVSRRVYKFVDAEGDNFEDKEILEKIELEVIEETKELDPRTATQVEEAIKKVENTQEEVAKKYGLEILFLYQETVLVYQDKIDWSRRLKKV